jgi:hypothetical protein
MARAGATKFAALDAWLRDNGDTLDAACHGLIAPDRAVSILRTITQRATDGRCDQTLQQLATATRMSLDQVKRALHALTVVGVLLTITPARSGGRGGGKGRAPVRLISFLTVTEASTGDADGLGITQNDRAVNQEWQRSKSGMAAQSVAPPYGSSSTDNPPTDYPQAAANAEPAAGDREGGNDAQVGQGQPTCSKWQATVSLAAAERMYAHDDLNGRTKSVRDPEAVKHSKARKVLPHLIDLQTRYPRLNEIAPRDSAWSELLTVLACLTAGEAASDQAWEALRPYRLALAAGDG